MKRLERETPEISQVPENDNVPHRRRRLRRTAADHFGTVTMILLLACSLVLFARLLATDLLGGKYIFLLLVGLLAVNAASVIVQVPLRRDKTGKLICGAVAALLSAVMLWGMSGVSSAQEVLNRITGRLVETDVIAVIVTADDPAKELADTVDYTFGYAENLDEANTTELIAQLDNAMDGVKTRSYASMTELADALYDDQVDAIILNKGYIALLQDRDGYEDFSKQTRIIFEHTITREIDIPEVVADVAKPFIIYCSGTDARDSDLSAKSRSDTNILAVVNPSTHQVLLLNTPRDYYIPLNFNGEMDKLTHAGLYGIDESMKTLDDLYGTNTAYYVRVNFNGLIDIVNALGGIDVESPMEFTTIAMEMPNEGGDGYSDQAFYFPEGTVHLNGREALAFSRERSAFADGDNQRGKNQMTVIEAIVDKATSAAVLSNFQGFLKSISDSFITNLSYKDMSSLLKLYQKGGDWNITTYSVTQGYGDTTQYTYTYGYAWVMWPDYDSVNTAKELIRQVMDGEVPTPPVEDDEY